MLIALSDRHRKNHLRFWWHRSDRRWHNICKLSRNK